MPGKPLQKSRSGSATSPKRKSSRSKTNGGAIARALDNYRRRQARSLKWKTYMVFQRKVMIEIDRAEPQTLAELERIPGLGPAKVERFGRDILELVRLHGTTGRR